MKKLFSVIFLLCMSIILLVACERNTSGQKEQDAAKKSKFPIVVTEPKYQKSAKVYIHNTHNTQVSAGELSISSSDLSAAVQLAETYAVIIQSNRVMEQVKEQFPDAEFTVEVKIVEETEIIQIIAESDREEDLAQICNAVVDSACQVLPEIVEGISCKVVDYAK